MSVNWERWGRASGAAFVVFAAASFIVGGDPPTVADPVEDLVSFYGKERSAVLVSSFLFAVALGFWLWFAGTLANNLRERGEGRAAATIIGAVAAFVSIQFVGAAVNAVLAYSVASDGEAGVMKALFDLTWTLDVLAAVPSAVFFLAASSGLLRTGLAPRWLSLSGLGVAVLFGLRATNWAREGFWSPTGEYVLILIPLVLLWILVTSVILFRSASTEDRPQAEPAAT